jgi:hypothetical protein
MLSFDMLYNYILNQAQQIRHLACHTFYFRFVIFPGNYKVSTWQATFCINGPPINKRRIAPVVWKHRLESYIPDIKLVIGNRLTCIFPQLLGNETTDCGEYFRSWSGFTNCLPNLSKSVHIIRQCCL